MKQLNRALASLLAAVMLVCMLPTAAFAGQTEGTPDEVIYNLLDMPVTVGTDAARTESEDELYFLFEEDGSFDILLEDNAFFPYEVQFTYGGETWSEWFMTPDDTVEVGGHTFTVTSNVSDPEALLQLGVKVGEDYIPAYPAKKEFTTTPQMSTFSLILHEYTLLNVDLVGYFPAELAAMSVEALLGEGVLSENSKVLWTKWGYRDENDDWVWGNDDYTLVTDGTLDLTTNDMDDIFFYNNAITVEMIVGTVDQLDKNNVKYRANITIHPAMEVEVEACTADAQRSDVPVHFCGRAWSSDENGNITGQGIYIAVDPTCWNNGDDICLSMSFPNLPGTDVQVYKGEFTSEEEMKAAGITDEDRIDDQLINADLTQGGGWLWKGKENSGSVANRQKYTFVVMRRGGVQYLPLALVVAEDTVNIGVDTVAGDDPYYPGERTTVWRDMDSEWIDSNSFEEKIAIDPRYAKPDDQLHLNMSAWYSVDSIDRTSCGIEFIKKAVVGSYATADAIPSGAKDIKEQLFSDAYEKDGGYTADYSNGVTFTIVDILDEVWNIKVTTVEYVEDEEIIDEDKMLGIGLNGVQYERNTWFHEFDCYEMPEEADSYYANGYRTVFLYDETPDSEFYNIVPDVEVFPLIDHAEEAELYLGHNGTGGEKYVYGETTINLKHNKPLTLSTVWNGKVKNYWVTFLTQQEGPSLFVNATNDESRYVNVTAEGYILEGCPYVFRDIVDALMYAEVVGLDANAVQKHEFEELIPQREVFLTEETGNKHDVFFANIGDEDITGLYVRLENAQNVALDEYWTINETTTLSAFNSSNENEMFNMGKIRLVPAKDENGNELSGEISGTLVIGYTGDGTIVGEEVRIGEVVRISLTGTAGTPKITTETVADATQHVPYAAIIQTNNMTSSNATFTVSSGKLPTGLTLEKNGEITGVPSQAGEFTFTVKAVFNNDNSKSDTKEFTLTVLEDTPENIEAVNKGPNGYEIEEHLGTEVTGEDGKVSYELNMKEVADEELVFVSEGEFDEFVDFYIDSKKLTRDVDYTAEEGSTKITVRAQAFKKAGNGQHVIAAAFNSGGTLKKTAQSVTISGASKAGTVKQYKITVEPAANGTITCTRTAAREKELVIVTVRPDTGYVVKSVSAGSGVYVSAHGSEYWVTMPASDVTISAVFEAIEQPAQPGGSGGTTQPVEPEQPEQSELPFGDVSAEDAFYEAVKFVYENGIMVGTGENTFAPDANLSRAMVVQVLYNYEKQPEVAAGTDFTDVTEGQWYTSAVRWATEKGVVAGYGDGTFGTDDDVTIEQVAVILWNYAGQPVAEGETVPAESSQWAVNALDWCAKQGVLEGVDTADTTVAATRAQTAQILMNFLSKLDQQ